MARIRTIKPDFFTSESVGALSWGARLTFAGLWTYVDDRGRAKDNQRAIRGALWPNDEETVSSADVARFIDELVALGMVCRYKVDGLNYLHVINMRKHQAINKPTESKLPECPAHANGTSVPPPVGVTEFSGSTPGFLPEDSRGEGKGKEREQGKEGKGTQSTSETASPPTDSDPEPVRDDVGRICLHLADRIERNGSKRPLLKKTWFDAARLMLDRDGRSEADVHAAIDWCQDSEFWRGNILSLPKLREKYDQLRLQAMRERVTPQRNGNNGGIDWDAAMARAEARDAAEALALGHTDSTNALPWED